MAIHPTAIIDKDAIVHESCEIGPYVIIEGGVKIGPKNCLMAGAFVGRGTSIGEGNEIHMGAVVGHVPQDKSFKNEESYLEVGNGNVIREHATIHRGSTKGSKTIIGNNCLLMGACHIAHDCRLGDALIIANMAGLAGHVEVSDRAFISGGAMIHQFVRIGRLAMVAGNARISMDVPPFVIAAEKNQVWAVNVVGLRRAGFSPKALQDVREMYRMFFLKADSRPEVIARVKARAFASPEVQEFLEFVEKSKRGVCKASHNGSPDGDESV